MWDSFFFNFWRVIMGFWNSAWALWVQAFVWNMWGEAGGERNGKRMWWSISPSKGTWDNKCWAYSLNHKEAKITTWKVLIKMFTSSIQALDLREGNHRTHVEAPIFIFTQGPSISASGLARIYCLLGCNRDKMRNHPNGGKLQPREKKNHCFLGRRGCLGHSAL